MKTLDAASQFAIAAGNENDVAVGGHRSRPIEHADPIPPCRPGFTVRWMPQVTCRLTERVVAAHQVVVGVGDEDVVS